MTKIKICGIRDIETAKFTENLGIDALGFILCPSKRRIQVNELKEITRSLKSDVDKVGVFVNQSEDYIKEAYYEGNLTMVQLHGEEDEDFIKRLPFTVIKAFNVDSFEEIKRALIFDVPYILLEGKGNERGGNGNSFPWELLGTLSKEERSRIILAGGLNAENVREAISLANPYMVDASSSLEVDGVKNKDKIEGFINKIRGLKYEI
ncbi:phosphoribosylanthranilate isomerase [Clostridium paridis]|uniref:N-(5'-phosphoribosyl)anthranilate isomerase n=1 Tax=Clostridium paridis TaxID=2803863 RepID=A0A937FIP8_9CLOT|nr:phosphoribosylanthranilate isomerase [Clostridium paridis]MBL4932868.1 phosphoribosylanthranilate isomerase [Clostridium paridis]